MITWAAVIVIALALFSNFWIWLLLAVIAVLGWLFYKECF